MQDASWEGGYMVEEEEQIWVTNGLCAEDLQF